MNHSIQWSDEMGQASPHGEHEGAYRHAIMDAYTQLVAERIPITVAGPSLWFQYDSDAAKIKMTIWRKLYFWTGMAGSASTLPADGELVRHAMGYALRAYAMGWGPFMFYRIGFQMAERLAQEEEGN